jgi:hypothetical protein
VKRIVRLEIPDTLMSDDRRDVRLREGNQWRIGKMTSKSMEQDKNQQSSKKGTTLVAV